MAWQTPKTDWHGSTNSEGVYTGDRFNASDFNRIKNNLTFLRDMAIKLYKEFSLVSLVMTEYQVITSTLMKSISLKKIWKPSIPTLSECLMGLHPFITITALRWISMN